MTTNDREDFSTDRPRLGAAATAETLGVMFFDPDRPKSIDDQAVREEYRITPNTTDSQLEAMLKSVFDEIERTGCLLGENDMPVSIDVDAARDYLHALRDERIEEDEDSLVTEPAPDKPTKRDDLSM